MIDFISEVTKAVASELFLILLSPIITARFLLDILILFVKSPAFRYLTPVYFVLVALVIVAQRGGSVNRNLAMTRYKPDYSLTGHRELHRTSTFYQ